MLQDDLERLVQGRWSLPLGVRLAVYLGVVIAALLPFVLTGSVAGWAALALVALGVLWFVGMIGVRWSAG